MPEVVIKYKKPETLKILKSLAKYLDFKVASDNGKKNLDDIFIPGDESLSISELAEVFTGKGIDAKKLREDAWKRSK
jgi:hypothetical protein